MNASSRHACSLAVSALVLALAAGCAAPSASPSGVEAPVDRNVVIRLIAINDFHGVLAPPPAGQTSLDAPGGGRVKVPLGGAAYLASEIAELKAQNPLNAVVGAGDLYSASPLESALFHDEPAIDALNRMGLEFSAVGNHEFDRGRADLLRMQAGTANSLLPELRAQGVNTVVVLIHQGGQSSSAWNDPACADFGGPIVDIVQRLEPAIDVVISAHTHNAYLCRLPSRDASHPVLVTSAGAYGRFVTAIDLDIDPATGRLRASKADNLAVINDIAPNPLAASSASLKPDPALAALTAHYVRLAAPQADRVVGRITADLDNKPGPSGESALGEVIADSQLAAAAGLHGEVLSLMNPGGVRNPILFKAGGDVTYGQIYSAQPFGNRMVTMTLSGTQVHGILEAQWQRPGAPTVLLPSKGFRYTWKASAPAGAKVDPASISLNGARLKPAGRYRVVVSNFLADGGDGFSAFTAGTDRQVLFRLDRDINIDYLAKHSPLAPPKPGRINRVD